MPWKPRAQEGADERTPEELPGPRPRRRAARRKAIDEANHPLVTAAVKAAPRQETGGKPPAGKQGAKGSGYKIELGVRWSGIVRSVKAGEYTWTEFCDGLDEEELARGQLRADDGTFVGRPPSFVPRDFLLAAQREQKRRFEEIFGSEVLGLAKTYIDLCKDANIPPKDRAKLIQYAMERIFGGIPKDIRIAQEQPWEQMVVNVHSDSGDMPEHLARRYKGYAEREGTEG